MRNVRLWRALLGVDKRTVIEDVELGDGGNEHAGAEVVIVHVRTRPGRGSAVAGVVGGLRGSTGLRSGAGGGRWMRGRRRCGWRRGAAGAVPRARGDGGGGAVGTP